MDGDQSLYEVVIPVGDYATYDDLKAAVNTALAATITAADSTTQLKINVDSITPTFVELTRDTPDKTTKYIRAYTCVRATT